MKTILITGANGNLGTAVVKALHAQGYQIIAAVGRSGADEIANIPHVYVQSLDILNEETTNNFAKEMIEKFKQIDVVISLVGSYVKGDIQQTDKGMLDKMFNLNFFSLFNIVKPIFAHYSDNKQGGKFIFIGAKPALEANEGKDNFAYSLSKTLVFKTAELINAEGKGKGITASVIVPSTIDSGSANTDTTEKDFTTRVSPEKIADLISFMLSDTGMMLKESVLKAYHEG